MKEEFPALKEFGFQKDFLRDWWVPKKVFVGRRQSGKTELMLSELRRFEENVFDCVFLAPSQAMIKNLKMRYHERFGEHSRSRFFSYYSMGDGSIRGIDPDVVIMDELQSVEFEDIQREIYPMRPLFIRASVDDVREFEMEHIDFFDSVYYSD